MLYNSDHESLEIRYERERAAANYVIERFGQKP